MTDRQKMGLVLSGGGARGAYEAGVLYHIRQAILKNRHGFDIHAGTSAGALNTCFMTSSAHQPAQQGARLRKIWENLRSSDVYKGDTLALSQMAFRLAGYTTSHLFGFSGLLKKIGPFRGILDTAPFVPFLQKQVDWERLNQNLKEGIFQAVAIATTNVGNGKLELFLNKRPEVEYTGAYRIHLGPIQWYHALASAAVPIVFPPVRIDHYYYVDGSMRQNTPMSPAVQLGADKVLIIGVRYTPPVERAADPADLAAAQNDPAIPTSVARTMDELMAALDSLSRDAVILCTGSFYTIGAIRGALRAAPFHISPKTR